MQKKKTTIITSETQEILVIRSMSQSRRGWCDVCGAEVDMLNSEEAAATTETARSANSMRLDARHLYQEQGDVVGNCRGEILEDCLLVSTTTHSQQKG